MKKNILRLSSFAAFSLLLANGLNAQSPTDRKIITDQYNSETLDKLEEKFKKREQNQLKKAHKLAKINNWPLTKQLPNGGLAELIGVADNGAPLYYRTFNVDAAKSTRTNYLHSNGGLGLDLEGQGMTAYVWDGGLARDSHQEFKDEEGNNRYTIGDTGKKVSYHGTHVSATIVGIGKDSKAKGMAPKAKIIGHNWISDLSEATAKAKDGMLLSNHSYGFDAERIPDSYFGKYLYVAQGWDDLTFNTQYYLPVVAAGNDGFNSWDNGAPLDKNKKYDKLSGIGVAKNVLTVANAQDAKIDENGNLISVKIDLDSSQGPTDDYRIKPDIAGNGVEVYSATDVADDQYISISGTSMASPNVCGSLLLLQQHYHNLNNKYMKASTLKGLALHTADDAGTEGPDAIFGWGLLNAKKCAEVISQADNGTIIEELTLKSGQINYSKTIEVNGNEPLIASISWTDRGSTKTFGLNDDTPTLVNDLDIRIREIDQSPSTTYKPYRLKSVTENEKGDNKVDPFERIDIKNPSGKYRITVSYKGSLKGGKQNFSLIVTGLKPNRQNEPLIVCNTPENISFSNITHEVATVNWDANNDATGYQIQYKMAGTDNWTTKTTSTNQYQITGLTQNKNYVVRIKSFCESNSSSTYTAQKSFKTTYQKDSQGYCISHSTNVTEEYIKNFKLGTIDNSSTANSSGYSNFTHKSTELQIGETVSFTITPHWPQGEAYNEGYAIWIDYNQDGDFVDENEFIWSKTPSTDPLASGTFTIADNALEGPTRLRVSLMYDGIPEACAIFNDGEVEDYTVNITNTTPVCQAIAPSGIKVDQITNNHATILWDQIENHTFVVKYKKQTNFNWTTKNTSNNTLTLDNLASDTTYEIQIKSICDQNNESGFTNSVTFKTLSDKVDTVTYCDSFGKNNSEESLGTVIIGEITNTTGASENGYADFTNLITQAQRESTVSVSISPNGSSTHALAVAL